MRKNILFVFVLFFSVTMSCENYMDDLNFQAHLNDGLVAYWPVVETSGAAVKDYSGYNHNILMNIPSYTSGKYKTAININSSQVGELNDPSFIDKSEITLGMWVNLSASNSNNFLSCLDSGFIFNENAGRLTIQQYMQGALSAEIDSSIVLSVGRWYYITVTCDARTMSLYINGSLEKSTTIGGLDSPIFDDFYFGGTTWKGLLDEIRVYNRVLSQDEIKALMEIGME
jgi:Concanavalin A-like lectin/glucanases superfamily